MDLEERVQTLEKNLGAIQSIAYAALALAAAALTLAILF